MIDVIDLKKNFGDVEVLKEIGFAEIRTDERIWQSVWSEEEWLNYASTPMFLVSGQKGEN